MFFKIVDAPRAGAHYRWDVTFGSVLSIGPRPLSDKNWEGPTGSPSLSIHVFAKLQKKKSA